MLRERNVSWSTSHTEARADGLRPILRWSRKKMIPPQLTWHRIAAPILLGAIAVTLSFCVPLSARGQSGGTGEPQILFVPATTNLVAGLNGAGYGGDGGPANSATTKLNYPVGMAYDSSGNLFIADESNYIVRRIDHLSGDISTFAGTPQIEASALPANGSVATETALGNIAGLAIDSNNNVYVTDRYLQAVYKITPAGLVSVFAGGGTSPGTCTGSADSIGDGCAATQATLDNPWAVSVDASNNVYIADSYNNLVRKIDATTGVISIFAGDIADVWDNCATSAWSNTGTTHTATQMHLCFPDGVAFDSNGNAYIADAVNDLVREISSGGGASILGGSFQVRSFAGDGGPVSSAEFNEPAGLYVDAANRLYISDFFNGRIRVVDSAGNINTVFGDGFSDMKGTGDSIIGEPDTEALASDLGAADGPYSVVMDAFGNLVVDDSSGDAVTSAGTTGDYIFPNQQIYSTSTPIYITVENPSGQTLTFTDPPTVNSGPFAFVTGTGAGTCNFPGSLGSGQTCTLAFTFTPTADQAYTGSATLDTNANSSPSTITLSGTGTGFVTPSASISGPASGFTSPLNVTSAPQPVTVTNTGVEPITLASTQFEGVDPNNFALASTTCNGSPATLPVTLNSGQSCVFDITFKPQEQTTYGAGFQVYVSTDSYGYLTANLSGQGTSAPTDTLGATSLNFYGQIVNTTSGVEALEISNPAGSGAANITFTSIAATAPFAIASNGANACSTTAPLEPDNVCYIYVTFSPTAQQNYAGTLTITSNDSASPQTVSLAGQGVIFSGTQNSSGTSATMNVSITGTAGTGELVHTYVLTYGIASEGFYETDTNGSCQAGTFYTPPQTCTVDVTIAPEAPGPVYGSIVLTDSVGNILGEVDLSGTGYGPLFAWEPGQQQAATVPSNGYGAPIGVATNVNGDLFVADTTHNRVLYLPGGSNPTALPAATPALNTPQGVAVDGLGDVFTADVENSRVVEWLWNPVSGSFRTTPVYIEGSFSEPASVALDNNGNLYVPDEGNNKVWEVPVQVGGTYGTPVQLGFTGLHFPKGVAVDASFSVYVADTGDGNIDKLPWNSTTAAFGTPSTIISGLDQPIALAVDASGSVYTGDAYGEEVVECPFNGSTYGTAAPLPITGLGSVLGIGLDTYGDLYVTDASKNDVQELFVDNPPTLNFATTAIGKTSTDSPQNVTAYNIGNLPMQLTEGTNPDYPIDFPVNSKASNLCAGNTDVNPGVDCAISVNFTPLNSGKLSEDVAIDDNNYSDPSNEDDISVNGTATGAATAVTLSPASLDFGGVQIFTTSFPLGVTVTANSGSVSLAGSAITQSGDVVFRLATGAGACTTSTTLTAGQSCTFYITYTPEVSQTPNSGTLAIGSTGQTVALSGIGLYFNESVGNSLSGQDVSVLITKAGTASAISVLTNGVTGRDYTNVQGGTCATSTPYTIGTVCSVDIGFAPQYAGARNGVVILTDASGNVLGETFLQGTGNAPQIIYSPTTATVKLGYATGLLGVAVDGADDLFYLDGSDNLQELAAGATTPKQIAALATLLSSATPAAITMDNAGDLFVASETTHPVIEVPSTGAGAWGTPVSIAAASAISDSLGSVATDALGNLYVLDVPTARIYQIPLSEGVYGTAIQLTFPTGYTFSSIAVDPGGDVYALGENNSTGVDEILELPATNTGFGTEKALASISGMAGSNSLVSDAEGNLYATGLINSTNGAVWFLGASGTAVKISTGLYQGLAVDGADNVFLAQANLSDQAQLVELPQAAPPSLTFKSTAVGSTSTDSPQVVTVTNIGNQSLDFNSVTYPTDFPEGSTANTECNDEFPVNAGANCTLTIDFNPTVAGSPLSEDVVLVDNALNGDGATQDVPVSGVATQGSGSNTASLTGVNFGNVGQGQESPNMAAVLTNNSTTTALNISAITKSGTNTADFYFAGGANACSTTTPLAAGASCNIWLYFIPTLNGNAPESATLSVTDSATNSPQTASITGTATGAPGATLSATSWNFGGVQINTASVPLVLSVTNTGSGELNITGESISQTGNAFQIVQGNNQCSSNLLPNGSSCDIYVTYNPVLAGSTSSGTLSIGGVSQTVALSGTGVSFVEPVLGTSANQLVSVTISTAGTFSYAKTYSPGASDYEFGVAASGSTCTSGTAYSVGQLCQVNVFFTPGFAGNNSGAVVLFDANNNILGETFLAGTGQGPQIAYGVAGISPGTVSSSLSGPWGVATDVNGNVYIADQNGSNVYFVPYTPPAEGSSGPGTYGTPVPLGGGVWDNPSGIALDGAGDVFVADMGNGGVWELPYNGTGYNTPVEIYNVGESDNEPASVAVDNYGNVYVGVLVPSSSAQIVELPQTNDSAFGNPITVVNSIATGFDNDEPVPFGLAVDTQGNVYAGVFSSSSVVEYSPTGPGTFSAGTTLSITGISDVTGIATDANNDLYLADPLNNQVVFYNRSTQTAFIQGQSAVAISLDQAGDMFLGLSSIPHAGSTDSVVEYPFSQPFALNFASSPVGQTSSDSPKSESIISIGNMPLTFTAVTYPTDFPENSGGSGACATTKSVAAGSSCDVSANFKPTVSGSLDEDVVLTDNARTLDSLHPQQIPVSGAGTGQAAPTVTLAPSTLPFGSQQVNTTSVAQTVTLTNSGTATLDISSIDLSEPNEDDGLAHAFGKARPNQLSIQPSPDYAATTTCGTTLTAGSQCTISVTFDPSTTGSLPGTLSVSDNAANSPQSVSLSGTGYTGGNFMVASPTPPQTVNPGGSAQYTINVSVTPTGDIYPNHVTLTATGLPSGATASFSPAQVIPGTGMVTSNMTIRTSSEISLLAPFNHGARWPVVPAGFALACCGMWVGFRRKHRERLARYFALVLLLASLGAATLGLVGCGGGFAQIQPTSYTVTVTGTSGSASASTTVQLTVE